MNILDLTTYINLYAGKAIGSIFILFLIFIVLGFASLPLVIKKTARLREKYPDYTERSDIETEMFSDHGAKFLRLFLAIGLPIGLIVGLLPSHDRILSVKIEKIKNEAVTEENLRQGVEVIERIGKKLECKYLGCEKK